MSVGFVQVVLCVLFEVDPPPRWGSTLRRGVQTSPLLPFSLGRGGRPPFPPETVGWGPSSDRLNYPAVPTTAHVPLRAVGGRAGQGWSPTGSTIPSRRLSASGQAIF